MTNSKKMLAGCCLGLGVLPVLAAEPVTPSALVETLVFVRHGEKPPAGLGQLACQGLNRSLALPKILIGKFGKPAAIYAPNPGEQYVDKGIAYNYIRPLATIEPTAIQLGMPVNTRYGVTQLAPLAAELVQNKYNGQTVFIAWEHKQLLKLVRQLMQSHGADSNLVPDWADTDFDSIYIVKIQGNSIGFSHEHEELNGQPTTCPA